MITKVQDAGGNRGVGARRELLCTADGSGRLTSVNADWQRVLGWTADELTSRPLADFVHPADRPLVATAIAEAMKPGGGAVEVEQRFRARGGRWQWLRMRIQNDGDSWLARATDVTDEHQAEEQLRTSLSADGLLAHRQPIVEWGSGALVQEELLARMRAPGDPGRILAPAEFLPQAERLGLVSLVDRRMVSLGLEMATRGRRAAVNLSARSIPEPGFMTEVEDAVRYAGPYAANLVFEITETAALENLDVAAEFAQRLNALGVGFALDDFGTGHGSLTELRALPIQLLKIDTVFVQNALSSERDRALVSGIVALARQLRIRTVAEGIEDAAMLSLMGQCGVDYAQGFFLGAPGPLEGRARPVARPHRKASTVMVRRTPARAGRARSRAFRRARNLGVAAAAALAICAGALTLTGVLSSGGGGSAVPSSQQSGPKGTIAGPLAVPPPDNYVPPGVFGAPLGSNRR